MAEVVVPKEDGALQAAGLEGKPLEVNNVLTNNAVGCGPFILNGYRTGLAFLAIQHPTLGSIVTLLTPDAARMIGAGLYELGKEAAPDESQPN